MLGLMDDETVTVDILNECCNVSDRVVVFGL